MIHVPDHIGSVMGKRRVDGQLHVFWMFFRVEQSEMAKRMVGHWAARALPFDWDDACTFNRQIDLEVERISRRSEHARVIKEAR